MNETNNSESLVKLIDKLAPINNKFRSTQDPIIKIETMWDFGQILDSYLQEHDLKLHELLYKIYDPYSRVKMSYITRDLGSYCYRIYKYFSNRTQIREMLNGLASYTAFRESIPLLFNEKYGLTKEQKREVISIISDNKPVAIIIKEIKEKKKSIRPINNPRNQRAKEYSIEKEYLIKTRNQLRDLYFKNGTLPSKLIIDSIFGAKEPRSVFVDVLMALASEAFINKVNNLNNNLLKEEIIEIYNIAKSNSQDRARFRKWVFTANELLDMAEGMHSLSDEHNYKHYRSKIDFSESLMNGETTNMSEKSTSSETGTVSGTVFGPS